MADEQNRIANSIRDVKTYAFEYVIGKKSARAAIIGMTGNEMDNMEEAKI